MCRFGRFELQRGSARLLRDGVPLPLRERALAVLQCLLERPGQVVGKRQLCELGWPGLADAENNLQVEISALRKLLGAAAIVTVPGRGYQFAAALEWPVLLGREAELQALDAMLAPGLLVTVTGEGGIGKSALAAACLRQRGDAARRVAVDAALSAQAFFSTLQRQHGLLLLDDCDAALQPAAELAALLTERCPGLTLLATSRERLGVPGERLLRLGGLWAADDPDAPAQGDPMPLLQTGRGGPPATAGALAEAQRLCRLLDGNPLALRLAAPDWQRLGGAELLARLAQAPQLRLDWQADAEAGLPERQHSLGHVLAQGHRRLAADEQALLDALARLPQPVTLQALTSTQDGAGLSACIDRLGRLVDSAWVRLLPGTDGPAYGLSGTTRLWLLRRA